MAAIRAFGIKLDKTVQELEQEYEKQFGPITYEDADPDHIKAMALYGVMHEIVNEPDVEVALDKLADKLVSIAPEHTTPIANEMYNWIQTLSAIEDGDWR